MEKSNYCNKTGRQNILKGDLKMYDNFILKEMDDSRNKIAGYHWSVSDPDYVVCLIHGIGEYAGRYERVAAEMNLADIAVVSMDLRGHGISFGTRGHCAPRKDVLEDIDDLIRYAEELYPDKPIILYGHSMGGNITLDYRKRGQMNYKLSGFIVSAPWVELVRSVSGPLYFAVKALAKIMPSKTISSGVSEKELGNKKSVGDYENNPLTHKRISLLCALDGFVTGELMASGDLEDNGGAEGKPMLLMHGTDDKICSINGSRKIAAIESCEYVEWPGLFHEIHNGGTDSMGNEVIEKIIHWIRAI